MILFEVWKLIAKDRNGDKEMPAFFAAVAALAKVDSELCAWRRVNPVICEQF
jgi:hypothetical protein